MTNEFKEYYFSIKNKKKQYEIFESEKYKLTELDLLNLIKMCIIERRSKYIGTKILNVYEDSIEDDKDIVNERLKKIGINKDETKRTIRTRTIPK